MTEALVSAYEFLTRLISVLYNMHSYPESLYLILILYVFVICRTLIFDKPLYTTIEEEAKDKDSKDIECSKVNS